VKRLIILGTGGNCLDILEAARAVNRLAGAAVYECVGFLDDNRAFHGQKLCELPVMGSLADAGRFSDCVFVNGIGSQNNFWKKADILKTTGLPAERFETILHPLASVSGFATLGRGCVVLAGATVGARAAIGQHVILLQGAIVSHDCRVGDFGCVTSGACLSGGVEVAPLSYIGANVSVRGEVKIGSRSLIGMGSVVLENVPDNTIVVCNPARALRPVVP
jgi:sugar O-acyltransferase (sialic acid O-acetyltransferase NeuD family)